MTELTHPLATTTWDAAEYSAIQRVVDSGRFTMGPQVREFEASFANHFGAKYAVMVNSGSSANLALIGAAVLNPELDLNAGDEVLVTSVSWATTYYPLTQYGLVPVLVDIDIDTLNASPERLRDAITPRTKAIFAVNLLGNPNDFSELEKICNEHDLLLFEDNCESMGATFDGRYTGTFGRGGTFSTFFSHHISTMEGGVITTDDEHLQQMMISLRAHGWTRELPNKNFVHDKNGVEFDDLFRFVLPGYNLRPLEMSGAIGLEQLKKVPNLVEGRRANATTFSELFKESPHVRIQKEIGQSSWFGFSFILQGALEGRRAELVNLFAESGIDSRPIVAGNFANNPVMRHLNAKVPHALTNADEVDRNGLFIGNHHYDCAKGLELAASIISSLGQK